MKRIILSFFIPVIAAASLTVLQARPEGDDRSGNRITIVCEEGLSLIAGTWAEAYERSHPGETILVSPVKKEDLKRMLAEPGTIGLVTGECVGDVRGENCRTIVVGRDVLVPVMNSGNPFREEILRKGISPEEFGRAYSQREEKNWGTVLGTGESAPIRSCVVAASTGISRLAEFLEVDADLLQGCRVESQEEFMEVIRGETYALGFCRLCDIVSCETGEVEEGLALVPVDANGNGTIDHFEEIYSSASDLARGVWIGKYPGQLYSRIYVITGEKSAGDAELAFLEWALSDGQAYLAEAGLNGLLHSERRVSLDRVRDLRTPPAEFSVSIVKPRSYLIISVSVLAGLILLWLIARAFRRHSTIPERISARRGGFFGVGHLSMPRGLFFDRSHTWVFMERNGEVRVGLADFIPHVTGRVTGVRMKGAGDRVKKGEPFLTLVQNGKQVTIPSPVTGVVQEQNSRLNLEPGLVNQDPLSDGWVYRIQPLNWRDEMKSYFMGDSYREWISEEFLRLRDFLASILVPVEGDGQQEPVLQDGGEIRDGVLEYFSPPVWEDFQTKFIHSKNNRV